MKSSYRGKNICKQLKAVRQRIAEENHIPLEQRECTYEGPCRGTCPRCEAEVQYLERALAHRLKLGKAATVAGLSLSLAACSNGNTTPHDTLLTVGDTLFSEEVDDTLPDNPLSDNPTPDFDEWAGEVIEEGKAIPPPPPPPPEAEDSILELVVDEEELEGEIRIFTVVENEPEFPGGMDALNAFLKENIRYPEAARKERLEGTVYVTFTVEPNGSISNPRILRDIGLGCGDEAIRIVKSMPRWKPGKQRGKPVRVQFNLPVKFKLN